MQKIQDYALIGNGRSVALISRDGSMDWLCWPRFDSSSLFAKIVDKQTGGHWKIGPIASSEIKREYIAGINVLQTRFTTESGIIIITDFMPAFSEEEKEKTLQPEHEIIRRVECEKGEVEIQIEFDPRPNYGRDNPDIKDAGTLGIRIERNGQLITLKSDVKLSVKDGKCKAQSKLKAGSQLDFSLMYSKEGPAVIPPLGDLITKKLSLTVDWWQNWCRQIKYKGPYKKQVERSALALKLLSYAPSCSIIAAPTTSLPERIRGNLNWDYRFCWLRDAAFTVKAFFGLGLNDEADAFVSWLLHSTRLTLPRLKVLYDVYGESPGNNQILPYMSG